MTDEIRAVLKTFNVPTMAIDLDMLRFAVDEVQRRAGALRKKFYETVEAA